MSDSTSNNGLTFRFSIRAQSGLMTLGSFAYAAYENLIKAHPGAPEQYVSAALAVLFGLKHTSLGSSSTSTTPTVKESE